MKTRTVPTMTVRRRETGQVLTINAADFDGDVYEAQEAAQAADGGSEGSEAAAAPEKPRKGKRKA